MEQTEKEELKLIIFLDDDGKRKEKYCLILGRNEFGIRLQLCDKNTLIPLDNVAPFEVPNHRVLKLKDINKKEENTKNE